MKDNFEIAMSAVKKIGVLLEFVSPRLQENFDIVFAAVS